MGRKVLGSVFWGFVVISLVVCLGCTQVFPSAPVDEMVVDPDFNVEEYFEKTVGSKQWGNAEIKKYKDDNLSFEGVEKDVLYTQDFYWLGKDEKNEKRIFHKILLSDTPQIKSNSDYIQLSCTYNFLNRNKYYINTKNTSLQISNSMTADHARLAEKYDIYSDKNIIKFISRYYSYQFDLRTYPESISVNSSQVYK